MENVSLRQLQARHAKVLEQERVYSTFQEQNKPGRCVPETESALSLGQRDSMYNSWIPEGSLGYSKEFGLYSECSAKPLEASKPENFRMLRRSLY